MPLDFSLFSLVLICVPFFCLCSIYGVHPQRALVLSSKLPLRLLAGADMKKSAGSPGRPNGYQVCSNCLLVEHK